MRDLMATVNAGNRAHQAVMAVDKQKGQFSKAEIERFTTAFLAAFSADCAFRLKPRIRFCDVDALIGSPRIGNSASWNSATGAVR